MIRHPLRRFREPPSRSKLSCRSRMYRAFYLLSAPCFCLSYRVGNLEVHPELRGCPEIACKTQCGIRCYRALLFENTGDPVGRYSQCPGQSVSGKAKVGHLFTQDLPRMDRTHTVFHCRSSLNGSQLSPHYAAHPQATRNRPATADLSGYCTALCDHPIVLQIGCSKGASGLQSSRHCRESATAVRPEGGMPRSAALGGHDRQSPCLCL